MKDLLLRLHNRINGIASVPLMLVLIVIMAGLAVGVISPVSPTDELKALANGRDVPDTHFWRTPESFYSQLEDHGVEGRLIHLTRMAPIDLVTPIAQLLFLSVTITVIFRQAVAPASPWHLLNLVPLLATLGDYLENASVVTMMWLYPVRLDALAAISAAFTAVKFIASIGSLALIGVGLAIWGSKRLAATSTKGRAAS